MNLSPKNFYMKNILLKLVSGTAFLFSMVILLHSCSKKDSDNKVAERYFNENVVNRDLTVHLATNNGTDITSQFDDLTFRFTKTASLSGTATATNDLMTIEGTWTVDAQFDNITIAFEDGITNPEFINRKWRIASRASSVIELTSADGTPHVLHFQRK